MDEPRVTHIDTRPKSQRNPNHNSQPPRSRNNEHKGSGKTVAAAIVAIFLIILLLLVIFSDLAPFQEVRDRMQGLEDEIPKTPFIREYPEGAEFEYDRTIIVSATGQFDYTLKVSSPMDLSSGSNLMQDVLDVSPNQAPDEGVPDPDDTNNNMLVWEKTINGGQDSVSVDYHVKTRTTIWEIEGADSGTVADINQTWKDVYNHDEWPIDENTDGQLDPEDDINNDGQWDYRIEPTNPQIKSLSDQLTSGKSNVYDKVKSIYEYLISDDVLDYETIRGSGLPKACTVTLSDLSGDCDDYSILFVSICRAADIPARLHLGVLYDPGKDDWIGHGWAEVYIPLNSGGAILGTVDVVNKQFLFRDPYRITDWIDTGGDVIEDGEYVSNLDYYYYSFTYRGAGQKESEDYNTISYSPYGKVLIEMSESEVTGTPSDESNGSSGFGFTPGFSGLSSIIAIACSIVIITFFRKNKIS
jgi:hypothetical protein